MPIEAAGNANNSSALIVDDNENDYNDLMPVKHLESKNKAYLQREIPIK